MTAPTVFVVDDEPAVLVAVERLLRSAGWRAATFASAAAFMSAYDPARPGCLLLDVAMPDTDGLEVQRQLADAGCTLPIIFLTGHGDVRMSVQAMRAGALNFITKPFRDETLLDAVAEAVEKDRVARGALQDLAAVHARLDTLTPRERDVLDGVVAGRMNKQIAADLGLAIKTVKAYRGQIMDKMSVRSLAELARLAERLGIAPDRSR